MTDAYIGSETGALKGIDFSKNMFQNYNPIGSLDRSQEISRMCRISTQNTSDTGESILCALVNRQMKLFDPSTSAYSTLFDCEGGRGIVKGLEELESGKVVTCVESGDVSVWKLDGFSKEATINAGDNISRLRRHPLKANTLATGGKENPLKVWDLHNPKQPVFTAKNVKHDWLDLRVPIWETDFRFIPANDCIITCTGHHHIRMYDLRSNQRRPVAQIEWGECPFTGISLTPREHQVVAGNSQGNMGLFDIRGKGPSKLVHCYRGFAGSITSVECHPTEPYVASCGIDRFARLHHLFTREQLNKIYCKARLNCLLLNDSLTITSVKKESPDNEDDKADRVYHSDEGNLTDDDAVWDVMRKVDESKKKRNRHSSASSGTDESIGSDSEKRTKSKRKKKRDVLATTPSKRPSSPSLIPKKRKKTNVSRSTDREKASKRKRKPVDESPVAIKMKKNQDTGK